MSAGAKSNVPMSVGAKSNVPMSAGAKSNVPMSAGAKSSVATGVLYPRGFRAAGVSAGLKSSGDLDVALVVNGGPSDTAAAVFTANRVKAAPVLWSLQAVADGRVRAAVLNSGGANACTGPDGFADTHRTAEHVARALAVGAGDVVVCSTGLIGHRLPMTELLSGVDAAVAGLAEGTGVDAARAICTTDSHPKQATLDAGGWRIGAMVKGAGMLAPSLATMLCVITTDAVLDAATADAALRGSVRTTFDRIDSDGCMSTNDTVLLMASGASGVAPAAAEFTTALQAVCTDLVGQLLADAEGSTKDVSIEVVDAASEDDAVEVGRAVARNNLLKCALFGADPNWGRVLAAVGTTSAAFEADELDVAINDVQVCRAGGVGDAPATVDLSGRDIHILIDLHAGDSSATVLTNDLSHAYVHENSAYST
jgi:glutamate N-acetyltransferase/amino-acid N-acetyltransferase